MMEFINVKERLPELELEVLVLVQAYDYHIACMVDLGNGYEFIRNDEELLTGVTHWAYLPELPKDD